MSTDLKTYACDYCGNFHDPAYSDCATGEPHTGSVAPPSVRSTDWMGVLHHAKTAIESVLKRDESMNAHELSLALHEAITFIEDEINAVGSTPIVRVSDSPGETVN